MTPDARAAVQHFAMCRALLRNIGDCRAVSEFGMATVCGISFAERKATAMHKTDLADIYRDYIDCLNARDWPRLARFVDDDAHHNARRLGQSGYREMLERDYDEIPDLRFNIALLVVDPPYVASRLAFNVAPRGNFLGLAVNGRRVSFTENVFYEFRETKIIRVWSVLDKAAIEAQL